jgi:basic amino acid/polyamine antiporter, APA family
MAEVENLKRVIPIWGSVALVLNGLIGAGIFALPGAAAAKVGSYSPLVFVVCAIMMLPVFMSVGSVASHFDKTGGPVEYTRHAFGPFWSFVTGWLFYFGGIAAMSANTNAFVNYVGIYWEWFGQGIGRFVMIGGICLLLTSINVLGVRQGVRTLYLFSLLKLGPLALIIVFGFATLHLHPVTASVLPPPSTFSQALMLVVYAFVGFEWALVPAGESKNPKRDIPRALLFTLLGTTILYVAIQFICVAAITDPGASKAPLADVARVLWGPAGAVLLTAAAIFSIAGNLSGSMLSVPRLTYSLANHGALPAALGRVHEKYKTPSVSVIFLGCLVFALSSTGTFIWLAGIASLAKMLGYAMCILSSWRLNSGEGEIKDGWKLPFFVPVWGLMTCAFLISQVQTSAWQLLIVYVAIGVAVYFFVTRKTATRLRR